MQSEQTSTILVADDNPTNVLLLQRALSKHGYRVLTADNGQAALELARQARPDLLLLDVMMPQHDGLEVCRLLKSDPETAPIPIIFVTARVDSDEVVRALTMGGSDYITKPFILKEVLARIAVHLRLRQFENELVKRNQELERLSAQLADMNVELARLTRKDPLTGLLNRRAWFETMLLEQERCRRYHSAYSILLLDVDYFKAFNDSQGHQAGDDCLTRVAGSITAGCRALDLIGRYGGEEFIVLAPETDNAGGLALAERIHACVADMKLPHPASPTSPWLTVSIGVATSAPDEPWESVVRRADEALYTAKQNGRNQTCAAECALNTGSRFGQPATRS
jgi:diguanylate cyclase (GGDEF)-like protein